MSRKEQATLAERVARAAEESLAAQGYARADRLPRWSHRGYVARTPQRQTLRFSRSRDAVLEWSYRTRWISSELPEMKREGAA